MDIKTLNKQITNCKKCHLWTTRKHVVPGEGNVNADVMFIGEAPGKVEDETGRPFVGRAGKLLDDTFKKVGITRQDVFITSILKCRPPNNRNPRKDEVEACTPYTLEQIKIISPKVIVPLGNVALKWLNKMFGLNIGPITKSHGKCYNAKQFGMKIKIMPIYHPAYVLRGLPSRRPVFESDMQKIFLNI